MCICIDQTSMQICSGDENSHASERTRERERAFLSNKKGEKERKKERMTPTRAGQSFVM